MESKEKSHCGAIKPISKDVVHQICSGQVILTLAVAVKELIENAIDAEASIIDITLREYGSESIEVCDNGKGVLAENFQALTLKHYTSKIEDFSDLQFLETLGFRGEALSSLCALADLSILTKHASTEQANIIKYDRDGKIIDVALAARQTGTTVKLENLFSTLPVRRKEFMKNLKREFNKMCQILYAYCLVSKGIKFTCTNITNNGRKNSVVATQGHSKVRENIISVFGAKQISSLIEVDLVRPSQDILDEFHIRLADDEELPFQMEFFISSVIHGQGRSCADRQFFYVNSRPVEPTKITKLINQTYKQFNINQYPFVYINITAKSCIVDINVTPDKRQVFLEKENLFLAAIKASLLGAFKLFPSQATLENQNISKFMSFSNSKEVCKGLKRSLTDSPEKKKSFFDSFRKKCKSDTTIILEQNGTLPVSTSQAEDKTEQSLICKSKSIGLEHSIDRKIESMEGVELNLTVSAVKKEDLFNSFRKNNKSDTSIILEEDRTSSFSISSVKDELEHSLESDSESKNVERKSRNTKIDSSEIVSSVEIGSCRLIREKQKDNIVDSSEEYRQDTIENIYCKNDNSSTIQSKDVNNKQIAADHEEVNIILDTAAKKKSNNQSVDYHISLQAIRDSIAKKQTKNIDTEDIKIKFHSSIAPENDKSAEEELQKHLSKKDFFDMKIIGQFNRGFIITRLGNDLFIIDQHASDEKYNFEQLQASTVLQKQVLVNPKALDLTAGNETILMENEEIFKKNGFHFRFDENAPTNRRVLLTAIPVSQNYLFGKDDIDEMLFMLKDSSHTMCRPSRVRAMFASRACRKSVMIGKPLSHKDMKQLVDHMGEIHQPWNCPHGRPTIRHLINMDLLAQCDDI